ncbi:MAG: class I SAM-dependent methyltransferase [Deltaproteobacteria bacterium]|nr:class I SAM-dependent methyltransferase [Deltaproteobacteria bacterium]
MALAKHLRAITQRTWSDLCYTAPGRALALRGLPNAVRAGYADPTAPGVTDGVLRALTAAGVTVREHFVDPEAYARYVSAAEYPPGLYQGNFVEKTLEHHLAFELLGLRPGETYIDVANAASPIPEVAERLYGVRAWRQDLSYPPGMRGRVLGGDAAAMPVPDGFAHALSLHCSFEHFEGDADARFITEARRVLAPGGRLCIVPLYLHGEYSVLTDPSSWGLQRPAFEPDATLCLARGYRNRHGRLYDVPHFLRRVTARLQGLSLTVYRVRDAEALDPRCYVRFAALLTRP